MFSIESRPEYKVDNTLDLMEELLSGVPSSKIEKKNPFEPMGNNGAKKSKPTGSFINEGGLGQPRSKSRISNSDLEDLLGIPEKNRTDNLDDLLRIE